MIGAAKIYSEMPNVKWELQTFTPIYKKCDAGCKSIPRRAKSVIQQLRGVFKRFKNMLYHEIVMSDPIDLVLPL